MTDQCQFHFLLLECQYVQHLQTATFYGLFLAREMAINHNICCGKDVK